MTYILPYNMARRSKLWVVKHAGGVLYLQVELFVVKWNGF